MGAVEKGIGYYFKRYTVVTVFPLATILAIYGDYSRTQNWKKSQKQNEN